MWTHKPHAVKYGARRCIADAIRSSSLTFAKTNARILTLLVNTLRCAIFFLLTKLRETLQTFPSASLFLSLPLQSLSLSSRTHNYPRNCVQRYITNNSLSLFLLRSFKFFFILRKFVWNNLLIIINFFYKWINL